MKNTKPTKMAPNKLAGLRLKTKAPITFKDRKKEANKKACRGKVKNERIEKE